MTPDVYFSHHKEEQSNKISYGVLIVLVALLSGYYVQYLSDTIYGIIISYLMLLAVVISSFKGLDSAVKIYLLFSLITPQFSRTFVEQVVNSNNQEVGSFYSFHSVQLWGLGLSVVAIIYIGLIALCKLFYTHAKLQRTNVSSYFISLYVVCGFLLLATIISTAIGKVPDMRNIISDARLFIVWTIGALVANLIYKDKNIIVKIYDILFFSICVVGVRTLYFLLNDYVTGTPNLEYATQAYVAYPLMFVFAMATRNKLKRAVLTGLSLLAAISMKREDIAFVFICIMLLLFLILLFRNNILRTNAIIALVMLILIAFLFVFTLSVYSPQSFDFLLYKFDFFSKLITGSEQSSGSVLVRLYEIRNIIGESINYIYPIFVGFGFGGYFDFSLTGFPINLGISDYSFNEILQNKFVRPHSFTNYIFLKGGLIFLIYYLGVILLFMNQSYKMMKKTLIIGTIYSKEFKVYLFCFLYAVFCVNMFWQPMHIFLFAFLLNLLLLKNIKRN
ncbi:TPA: O93 family O-antigen polymerase [Escherichia coli]|nr:O93 family O-antigen polymerase [Escherichia coli]